MSIPDLSQLEEDATRIVKKGIRDGNLTSLTTRIVRREIEKLHSLEPGTLDQEDYSKALKNATLSAMEKESSTGQNAIDHENKVADPKSSKKPRKTTEDNTAQSNASTSQKKARPSSERKSTNKGSNDPQRYKSSAYIEDSDVEMDDNKVSTVPVSKKAAKSRSKDDATEGEGIHPTPPKKKRKVSPTPDAEDENAERLEKRSALKQPHAQSSSKAVVDKLASGSELSVLSDDPPKKAKKSKSKEKAISKASSKKQSKEKKTRKQGAELSKDEETVKRLKALVFACGTRKAWVKEFQGLDQPSQQIKRLKDILAGLGMTGRMSLEQARAIKQKKELEQELEDVKSFEKAVVAKKSKSKSGRGQSPADSDNISLGSEDGGDSDDKAPAKKRATARMSIMAFLGDSD